MKKCTWCDCAATHIILRFNEYAFACADCATECIPLGEVYAIQPVNRPTMKTIKHVSILQPLADDLKQRSPQEAMRDATGVEEEDWQEYQEWLDGKL